MFPQPIIKVEVERMHAAIMTMLDAKHEDMRAMLETAIENAMATLQEQANKEAYRIVNVEMNKALTNAIQKLFWYDGPLVKRINDLVVEAAQTAEIEKRRDYSL